MRRGEHSVGAERATGVASGRGRARIARSGSAAMAARNDERGRGAKPHCEKPRADNRGLVRTEGSREEGLRNA